MNGTGGCVTRWLRGEPRVAKSRDEGIVDLSGHGWLRREARVVELSDTFVRAEARVVELRGTGG
jgi:hypothetical protein